MELIHNFVASFGVIFAATILIIAYIFIAIEKIPKVTIALLGGALTIIIIGAAANVIVSESAAHKGYPISFMKFLKYGVITILISLILSTIYIYIRSLHQVRKTARKGGFFLMKDFL